MAAFRRSVAARASLFYQQQLQQRVRVALPLSRDDNDRQGSPGATATHHDHDIDVGSFSGSRKYLFGDRKFAPVFVRNMSSSAGDITAKMNSSSSSSSSLVADYINYIDTHTHTLTCFDLSGSVAVAAILFTVLIHTLHLPFILLQIKTYWLRSEIQKIKEEEDSMRNDMNPDDGAARMCQLSNREYNRRNYKALFAYTLFVVPLFSTAISSMALMAGSAAMWITHLNAIYIFPTLTLITIEFLFFTFITSKLCEFAFIIAILFSPKGRKLLGLPSLGNTPMIWKWVGWGN